MFTFSPSPVISVAVILVVAVLAFAARPKSPGQPAMIVVRTGRGSGRRPAVITPKRPQSSMMAAAEAGASTMRRMLHEAFGNREPARAETGQVRRVSPWRRLRSAFLLLILLGFLGLTIAATLGLIAFLAGFLLEQAIG